MACNSYFSLLLGFVYTYIIYPGKSWMSYFWVIEFQFSQIVNLC